MQRFLVGILFASVPAAATAQVPERELVQCAGLASSADRLACYDAIGDRIPSASAAVAARNAGAAYAALMALADAAAQKVETFGAESTAKRDMMAEDRLSELKAVVSRAELDDLRRYYLTLDNGQVWKQLDGTLAAVRSGDTAVLQRSATGGYRLRIEGRSAIVRAARVR